MRGAGLPKAALLAALGAWSITFAAAAPRQTLPGISGSDDRVRVESVAWPWSAVGRVNRSAGGYCTGTMIGLDKVLTAAHCLWNVRTGNWLPPSALHFVAGYRRGSYVAHSVVRGFEIADGRAPRLGRSENVADDWAVLTLERPLGKITGVIPITMFSPRALTLMLRRGGVFQRAGYSRDRSHVLQRDRDCNVVAFSPDDKVLDHDCDATFGDSGSPLLMQLGDDYQLVGLHVGTATRNGIVLGVAVGSARFRDWIASRAGRDRREVKGPTTRALNAAP